MDFLYLIKPANGCDRPRGGQIYIIGSFYKLLKPN